VTTPRRKLGDLGERDARAFLERAGMTFIEANWRAASGEIDLVMKEGEFVVIVEVKVRRGARAGTAEEAISVTKAHRLLATGEWYMAAHPLLSDKPWRIDLLAITIDDRGRIAQRTHVRDAVVVG
jgi:putative endonuclease